MLFLMFFFGGGGVALIMSAYWLSDVAQTDRQTDSDLSSQQLWLISDFMGMHGPAGPPGCPALSGPPLSALGFDVGGETFQGDTVTLRCHR